MNAVPAELKAPLSIRPLSPSQVNTYLDCEARWYYGSVAKLPDPATGSLALGRAVHHVCGIYLTARRDGQAPDAGELGEAFRCTLEVELEEAELREDEDPAALLNDGLRLLAMFCGQIAPQIEAAAVELAIHGRIGNQHVRGIVDVIDTKGVVFDLKTSAKKPGSISANDLLQLVTYGILAG